MNRMRPIRETISLEAARELIDAAIRPIERTERVRIDLAVGRVVARPVVARADVPPFARAAMDGYAMRAADTFGASTHDARVLACIETVFTGQVPTKAVGPGQCTEIATGAPVPEGADAVVMVEETEKQPDQSVRIFSPVYPGPERDEAGRRHPRRSARAASGRRAQPEPHRSRGRPWRARRRGLRAAPRGDPLDRQRGGRSRAAARAGPHLRHQQVHAEQRAARARRVSGAVSDRAGQRAGPDARARGVPRRRCGPVLRRQLGRRTRPHPRRGRADGRGAVPRDRGEARQADALRHHLGQAGRSACPATPRRASRTPTCC